MFRSLVRNALPFLALAVTAGIAPAQETVNYASVSGRITDPSSAFVEGAQVTAHQMATNFNVTTKSDREGRFRFP